jgi:hypothetical protein
MNLLTLNQKTLGASHQGFKNKKIKNKTKSMRLPPSK